MRREGVEGTVRCDHFFAHCYTAEEIYVRWVMKLLSGIVVVAFGFYLIALAAMIVIKPLLAERFLKRFASSARAHYLEQTSRLIAGVAIVIFSPSMWYPDLFKSFGWLIIITAVGLFLFPWKWHHRFSKWAIPLAIRHLRLYALGAFALGTLILYGAARAILS